MIASVSMAARDSFFSTVRSRASSGARSGAVANAQVSAGLHQIDAARRIIRRQQGQQLGDVGALRQPLGQLALAQRLGRGEQDRLEQAQQPVIRRGATSRRRRRRPSPRFR